MSRRRCRKCEQIHQRCSGHKKHTDPPAPCMAWPRKGGRACDQHGGATRTAKAAAARAAADQAAADQARAALRRLDAPAPVGNELEELRRIAGEARTWLMVVRDQAQALIDADTLTIATASGEDARAVIRLYERALDRAAQIIAMGARLKIDDRLTAITERDLDHVERAIEAAHQAGADGASLDTARAAAAAILRGAS
jgi:hypothetical protein